MEVVADRKLSSIAYVIEVSIGGASLTMSCNGRQQRL